MLRICSLSVAMVVLSVMSAASQQVRRVNESEPNNTVTAADAAALGDTLTGAIANDGDFDFFSVDIPAGTFVRIPWGTDLGVCLVDQDGVTLLSCNDPHMFTNVSFPLTMGGRYFVRIRSDHPSAGAIITGPYRVPVQSEPFVLDAGDPVQPRVTLSGSWDVTPGSLAGGLRGELYLGRWDHVLRIDPDGDTTRLGSDLQLTGDMVVDAFGDLVLVRAGDNAGIWKMSPNGAFSRLTADIGLLDPRTTMLAVGPDGDLWVGNDVWIMRLGPTGTIKQQFHFSGLVTALAVSPSGDPYFRVENTPCFRGIHVIRGGVDECAFPNSLPDYRAVKLAFGADGQLYVGHEGDDLPTDTLQVWGHVNVLSGDQTPRSLAHVPFLKSLTFVRDAQGNMTSRLLALQVGFISTIRRIVEINGAADRPIGAGFNVRFFHAALDSVVPATLGVNYHEALHITPDTAGLTWRVEDGRLPPGVTLSAAGVLEGVPSDTGSFAFTIRTTSGNRSWFANGTIAISASAVSITQVTDALLGGPPLSPALVTFLDVHGNKNGILDIGDLRALLRSKGQLSPHGLASSPN